MNGIIRSLQIYYGNDKLKELSIKLIKSYCSRLTSNELCLLFSKTFKDDVSFFGISQNNIREIFGDLAELYYHNEAFVKSQVIKTLKKKSGVTLYELPVINSRADVVSIGSKSIAYEIKTKYDTLDRLLKQIEDYVQVFEYVYVVCSDDKVMDVLNMVPSYIGIYSYKDQDKKLRFSLERKASRSIHLSSNEQLKLLRISEKPRKLESMSLEDINSSFKKALEKRYRSKWSNLCSMMKDISLLDYQYYFELN